MIRIAKLTDYGILLLTCFARHPELPIQTARDLAAEARLPLPTVSKLLKALSRRGLLVSHRGVRGGYSLARPPEAISVVEVIDALEGPIAMTDCSPDAHGLCTLEPVCPVQGTWRRINHAVREALTSLSLADMARPLPQPAAPPAGLLRLKGPAAPAPRLHS